MLTWKHRGRPRPSLSVLAVPVLALTLVGCLNYRSQRGEGGPERDRRVRAESFTRQVVDSGLPPDLYLAQSHLDELWLSGFVTSVDWLSTELRYLKLRHRPGNPTLPTLDLPYTQIPEKFEKLPESLIGLDISDLGPSGPDRVNEDALTTLAGLPLGLQFLNINGNDRLRSLEGLPRSLTSLAAMVRGIDNFSSLPPSLSCLELSSPKFESPQALPRLRDLQSLKLHATGVTSLHGLPESIVTLELLNNRGLDTIDELPQSITALSVDFSYLPSLDLLPPNLQDLHLRHSLLEKPKDPKKEFFKALKALTLNQVRVPDWTVLPASLESLALIGMPAPPALPAQLWAFSYVASPEEEMQLPAFPGSLEVLRLSSVHVADLSRLPRQLTGLAISNTTLKDLVGCPAGLTRLDLRSIRQLKKITEPPQRLESLNLLNSRDLEELSNLPDSLRYLNVGGTGLGTIPRLPKGLLELDISGTKISRLRGLPPGLLTLTVSQGQLRTLDGLPDTVRKLRFVDTPLDRAEMPHFGCGAPVPHFERWPCVRSAGPAARH